MNMTLGTVATVSLALAMQLVCLAMAEQQQREQEQDNRRQARTPQAQVIRSVNPVVADKAPITSSSAEAGRQLDLASLIRQQNQNQNNRHRALHVDKRSSQEQRAHRSRDQMMHLLLQELPQLDIEALNGPHTHPPANMAANNNQEVKFKFNSLANIDQNNDQQQQQQEEAANLASLLSAAGNRLRGRAAFSANAGTGSALGPQEQPTVGTAHFRGFDLEGGVSATNSMKRTQSRHVPAPCGFFNAITCF